MDEKLHGVLHGMQWIMFHGLPNFESRPPQYRCIPHLLCSDILEYSLKNEKLSMTKLFQPLSYKLLPEEIVFL